MVKAAHLAEQVNASRATSDALQVRLLFYLGIPGVTALLFGLNYAGMARLLPSVFAIPYWLGLTIPFWALLDLSSRLLHRVFMRYRPHRWLILFGGALLAMAIFSPYVIAYTALVSRLLLGGMPYAVNTPFPEAFLDLRRFAAFSGVPIYWSLLALFFARYLGYPPYLIQRPVDDADRTAQTEPVAAATGELAGFWKLLPAHLGEDLVSLSAEDHYLRVHTTHGNALVRYRFGDALRDVAGIAGIQTHRSHWVAVKAIARVKADGKGYRLLLHSGGEAPVSRSNVGVLRAAGLV